MFNVLQDRGSEESLERLFPWGDVAVVAFVTLAAGLAAVHFELGESTFAATRRWEGLQLDELPAVLLALSLTLTWFAWRRYRDARTELGRRRAAEARLANLLLDNRHLAQQYLQVQESERKLLARELHDELGQYLNAIKIDAVSIQQRASDGASAIAGAASAIIRHADHLYAIVRDLIRRLRPTGLDELGLRAALEQHVNEWRRRLPHVDVTVSLEGELDALGEPLALALYRLLQEGMTNVSRHARAAHVDIRVHCPSSAQAADEVVFSMADDGCGAELSENRFGLGLVGMRERVEMLGGEFCVTTRPARGFSVLARIPNSQSRAAATP